MITFSSSSCFQVSYRLSQVMGELFFFSSRDVLFLCYSICCFGLLLTDLLLDPEISPVSVRNIAKVLYHLNFN